MRALVTGGGGFLGAAIVARLRARGDAVVVLGRGRYPAVEALGVPCVPWDLATEKAGLAEHFRNVDVVFHVAARAGVWGKRAEFVAINVDGTQRVIDACREAGVGRLVFTGSPSATFDGSDAEGKTEAECPYPATFEAFYPETKAIAEQRVLAANGPTLATTALRPHLIYGPGDPHLMPRLIDRARKGRLAIVGDGKNRVGLTYVDNGASAHVSAADALAPGSANAGKAYFITDPEPVVLWDWINAFLVGVGEAPVTRRVPLWAARGAGTVLQALWGWLGRQDEPPMTPFVASQLATSHWYDLSAAVRDFGYAPPALATEGFQRTVAAFREVPRV